MTVSGIFIGLPMGKVVRIGLKGLASGNELKLFGCAFAHLRYFCHQHWVSLFKVAQCLSQTATTTTEKSLRWMMMMLFPFPHCHLGVSRHVWLLLFLRFFFAFYYMVPSWWRAGYDIQLPSIISIPHLGKSRTKCEPVTWKKVKSFSLNRKLRACITYRENWLFGSRHTHSLSDAGKILFCHVTKASIPNVIQYTHLI